MKLVVGLIVALIVLGGGAWWFSGEEEAPPPEAVWAAADRGDLFVTLEADGTVRPLREVEVKSKASGEILSIEVEEGEFIEEGDPLVILDPVQEQRNLARAEAERLRAAAERDRVAAEMERTFGQAQSALTLATEERDTRARELERLDRMGPDQVSASQRDQAVLALRQAEDSLTQAQQELTYIAGTREAQVSLADAALRVSQIAEEEARDRLADTRVSAPIRGVLLRRLVEPGQTIQSGLSSASGGTPLAVIGDLSTLVVEAYVDETDIGRVSEATGVVVELPSIPGRPFAGVVAHIAPRAEEQNGIPRIRVKVHLTGSELPRRFVDVRANVRFILDERRDAVRIPSEAIRYDHERVYVVTRTGERSVEIGADTGEYAEVLSGLESGDEVEIAAPASESWRPRRPR